MGGTKDAQTETMAWEDTCDDKMAASPFASEVLARTARSQQRVWGQGGEVREAAGDRLLRAIWI